MSIIKIPGIEGSDAQMGFAARFWKSLRYATECRCIVKAGIGFAVEKLAMTDYIIED